MASEFSFARSIYQPWLDTTAGSDFEIRETVVNIGQHGGNFWNWTGGSLDVVTRFLDSGSTVIPTYLKPVIGDTSDQTVFYQHPMRASWASVEIYIRAHFAQGTGFYQVSNIHLIATRLDLSGYGDGAYLNGRMADNYPTGDPDLAYLNPDGAGGPAWRPNSIVGSAPTPMTQSQDPDAGHLDLTPGSGVGGPGYSRYAILQLHTGENPQPGEGGSCDFALYYDES